MRRIEVAPLKAEVRPSSTSKGTPAMRTTHHRRGLYAPDLLEARIAPATFIVNTLADTGMGSLRDAVNQANMHAGADMIVFDKALAPGVIHVLNTEIKITDTLTIKGPGIDIITLSGDSTRRIFNIDGATAALTPVTISGLTLIDGKATDGSGGGAIYSAEPLNLKNVVVASSYASFNGGGVAVVTTTGKVSIVGSLIAGNTTAASTFGGGLFLRADAGISIVKSTIADNTSATG